MNGRKSTCRASIVSSPHKVGTLDKLTIEYAQGAFELRQVMASPDMPFTLDLRRANR